MKNESFNVFLKSRWRVIATAVGIGALLHGGGRIVELCRHADGPNLHYIRVGLLGLQAVTCFVIFVMALTTDKPRPEVGAGASDTTVKACNAIHTTLVVVFLGWTAYYLAEALMTALAFGQEISGHVRRFLSLITTAALFALYVEMSAITVRSTGSGEVVRSYERDSRRSAWLQKISFAAVCAILFSLSLATLPSSALPESWHAPALQGIDLSIAVLGGMTLALVVACLNHAFITPGVTWIWLLMGYAFLQVAAVGFNHGTVHLVATTAALPLKVILYLVFAHALVTGRLYTHCDRVRSQLIQASTDGVPCLTPEPCAPHRGAAAVNASCDGVSHAHAFDQATIDQLAHALEELTALATQVGKKGEFDAERVTTVERCMRALMELTSLPTPRPRLRLVQPR